MKTRLSFRFLCLVVLLLILAPPLVRPKPGIEAELLPYFVDFALLGQSYHGPLFKMPPIYASIDIRYNVQEFETKDSGVLAWCDWGRYPHEMIINQQWWTYADHVEREMVVFHELGHCALYRDHLNDEKIGGDPVSLMNWTIFSESTYNENREYYLRELFTGRR
jgi:hypothetical protein